MKDKPGEKHSRTVAKAVSWRVIATITTMTLVYVFTREWVVSVGVGITEVIAKILFYYLHERAWDKIAWGKKKHPLSSLHVQRELEPDDMDKLKNYLKDLGYLD
jgi:uncharacterized membrane protein